MAKITTKGSTIHQKIVWIAVGIFGVSGILPWFTVKFPIGNLKISVFDIVFYFSDPGRVPIDFYSSAIYGVLFSGWIFGLCFLFISAIIQKPKLLFVSAVLATIPPIIWSIVVPYLKVQMIFLSLSNQPINADQSMGSGQVAAMIAGFVLVYTYIRSKIR